MQSVHLWGNIQGRIQDFQLGGAHLKKLRRAEGGAKNLGVFRVKNHDFTPKNLIFSNFRGGARRVRPPPPGPAPDIIVFIISFQNYLFLTNVEKLESFLYYSHQNSDCPLINNWLLQDETKKDVFDWL